MQSITPKTKDISFLSVFWRKFMIRIIIFVFIAALVLILGSKFTRSFCDQKITAEITETSLKLAQLGDSGLAKDRHNIAANVILSGAYDEIMENEFITDSSISLYNLTKHELVAKSYEIATIDSQDAMEWWRKNTDDKNGYPQISLTQEMMDFCYKHKTEQLLIKKMYCINSIIFPAAISAQKENGDEIDSYTAPIPSATASVFEMETPLRILGNKQTDRIYGTMSGFLIKEDDAVESGKAGKATVLYHSDIDFTMLSKNFSVNNEECQIDIGYEFNFWAGAWEFIALFELLGLLLCGASAFISTKESFSLKY